MSGEFHAHHPGLFSFLPDLTDEQILTQIQYCLGKGWAVNLEFTDDPHPRNTYWEMWGAPMFDLSDAAGVMLSSTSAEEPRRPLHPPHRLRLHAWLGAVRLSFIVNRPKDERASGWSGPKGQGRSSGTRCAPTRPTGPKASVTHERGAAKPGRRRPARIDLAAAFAQSGVGAVLEQLDANWSGLRRSSGASARSRRCCWSTAALGRPRRPSRRRCTCPSPAIPAPARRRSRCAWRRSCTGSATSAAAIS